MKSYFAALIKNVSLIAIGAAGALYLPEHVPFLSMEEKVIPQEIIDARAVDTTGPAAPAIRVMAAEQDVISEYVTATGTIVPREEALVGADVSGLKVEELLFDTGDRVNKGDVLARLDRSTVELQLVQTEAQLAQVGANTAQAEALVVNAEVAVRQAQEQLDRVTPLLERGVATMAQRDNAINALDSTNASLNSARQAVRVAESQRAVLEAQRKQAELQLDKTEVIAPVSGVVLERSATIGQVVSGGGGPLFRIAVNAEFELAARVAEDSLPRVSPGQTVLVTLPGHDAPVTGTVRLVDPVVERATRLGTVDIALPGDGVIRSGSFAEARIEIASREGVIVPSGAVMYRGRDAFVQKVVENRIVSQPIVIGLKDGPRVEVAEGLAAGDLLVERAGTFVADGDLIRPMADAQTTAATN